MEAEKVPASLAGRLGRQAYSYCGLIKRLSGPMYPVLGGQRNGRRSGLSSGQAECHTPKLESRRLNQVGLSGCRNAAGPVRRWHVQPYGARTVCVYLPELTASRLRTHL